MVYNSLIKEYLWRGGTHKKAGLWKNRLLRWQGHNTVTIHHTRNKRERERGPLQPHSRIHADYLECVNEMV